MHHYGIDINELQTLISVPVSSETAFGSQALLASTADYRLEQFVIEAGKEATFSVSPQDEITLFVEEGCVLIGDSVILAHMQITLPPSSQTVIAAREHSVLYAFSGAASAPASDSTPVIGHTTDFRDKYWGSIETMVNAEYTGKRLLFKKGKHSSLHFHCNKLETYYIHSGELFVRLRAGRGEDRSFTLRKGDTLLIPPGLMHQDGGNEDTVIIEVSTHDEDSDSFIVEDGATTDMPGFGE